MIRLITETSYNWVDTLPMMGKKVPVFGFQVEKGKKKMPVLENTTTL